jgi:formate dehydrogenase subunit gamma
MTPASASRPPVDLLRFTLAERAVHWVTAVLTLACIATAAILYNGSLAVMFGHRRLVQDIHVYCGFALPAPMLLGLRARAYRIDGRRLNRFTKADWRWLRSRTRRDGRIPVGKFNAGQKLNAALSAGSIGVLFGTGLLMYFTGWARLAWRTGATFVHDWVALALGIVVIGHITYAFRDAESRRGMRTGRVGVGWAEDEHATWAREAALIENDAPES